MGGGAAGVARPRKEGKKERVEGGEHRPALSLTLAAHRFTGGGRPQPLAAGDWGQVVSCNQVPDLSGAEARCDWELHIIVVMAVDRGGEEVSSRHSS